MEMEGLKKKKRACYSKNRWFVPTGDQGGFPYKKDLLLERFQ